MRSKHSVLRAFAIPTFPRCSPTTSTRGIGAFVGGAFWLVGSGAVSLPVTSIVTSLASLGTGSAVGTLLGALAGRRFPEYQERYEGRVRRGDILISVHCENSQWTKKAMAILKLDKLGLSHRLRIEKRTRRRALYAKAFAAGEVGGAPGFEPE